MVFITACVWVRLYVVRIREMREKRIRPQQISSSRLSGELLANTNAADNFRNLFEVPVLFYVAATLAFATQATTITLVVLAWVYVALRATHSIIHCTYNRVSHRFVIYAASTLVLFSIWGVLGVTLLGKSA